MGSVSEVGPLAPSSGPTKTRSAEVRAANYLPGDVSDATSPTEAQSKNTRVPYGTASDKYNSLNLGKDTKMKTSAIIKSIEEAYNAYGQLKFLVIATLISGASALVLI